MTTDWVITATQSLWMYRPTIPSIQCSCFRYVTFRRVLWMTGESESHRRKIQRHQHNLNQSFSLRTNFFWFPSCCGGYWCFASATVTSLFPRWCKQKRECLSPSDSCGQGQDRAQLSRCLPLPPVNPVSPVITWTDQCPPSPSSPS